MERSSSWEFCTFKNQHRNHQFSVPPISTASSSLSSVDSFSEFDRILQKLKDIKSSDNYCKTNVTRRTSQFFTFPRIKRRNLKKSSSLDGRCYVKVEEESNLQDIGNGKSTSQQFLELNRKATEVPGDIEIYHASNTTSSWWYSDDDEDESDNAEEDLNRQKRRKVECGNGGEPHSNSNCEDCKNWNWLLRRCTSDSGIVDVAEQDEDTANGLLPLTEHRGRRRRGESESHSSTTDSRCWCTTLQTTVKFQRMRSCSVTLWRDNSKNHYSSPPPPPPAPSSPPPPPLSNIRPTLGRSCSIDSMFDVRGKLVVPRRYLDDESLRPRSWMRASMRLVRPFQLADPPSPASSLPSPRLEPIQIHLPPVFPCDVIECPSSTPTSDRPRQYGRRFSSLLSSSTSPESASSPSNSGNGNSSSVSTLAWQNDTIGARVTVRHRLEDGSATVAAAATRDAEIPAAPLLHETMSRNESLSSSTAGLPQLSTPHTIPTTNTGTYEMSQESESPLGQWSHGLSSVLACLGCTVGIFNISRFAIFSIHFGANFIFQFLVLTVLIGIPLFTFHISLGQLLGTGVLNMWHISPIFKGIGVALLLSQAFIGVYSIIGVSWMFVYLRDSFISKQDVYRWAEPLELYVEDGVPTLKHNNGSYKIEQTVPDYFGGVVLQRRNVLKQEEDLINVKFSVAFNLAIVWIIIFLCLSKGLKSYGKVVYVFTILPIFGMTLLCAKLLGFLPGTSKDRGFLPDTDWSEFFLNSKSWIAAFTEVFLTWGIFGATAMQITSHNRQKHFLYRDSALVVIITVSVLLLSAFIANMCSQLLEYNNFFYLPSSFERSTTYIFLQRRDIPLSPSYSSIPVRWMTHSGLILGERTIKPATNIFHESGYQPLRLATELVPATFAAIGPKIISPFWSILFYFVFIMFGLSQQLAIWYSVISNIVSINVKALKPCWTTITWFTCVAGFIMGLPMTTETGIFVVYFLDFVVGCGWWIMILYLLQLGAVFIVRGRPYSGETIVTTLFTRSNYFLQNWIAPMFSFNWNVILPVTLLLLSTSVFKNGGYRMLYNWHSPKFYEYWPPWSRKFGCLLQVFPLFIIPLVGIIQSYLYLTEGPLDLFERIQLLYRPVLENSANLRNANPNDVESSNRNNGNNGTTIIMNDDPPPKYTPPPSYSTATGARIAKLLRQSFRRSVVRIAQVLGTSDSTPSTSDDQQTSQRIIPPPPDYSTVLVEINQSLSSAVPTIISPPSIITTDSSTRPDEHPSPSSTLTAQSVATILRTSLRTNRTLPVRNLNNNNLVEQECTSIQCLVESAAPINQDSIIMLDELKAEEQSV